MTVQPIAIAACKNPKVDFVTYPEGEGKYKKGESYAGVCVTGGACKWRYENVVKGDVREHITRHRADHKAGVPRTTVGRNLITGQGFLATCGTHWTSGEGCTTRADVVGALDHHLSTEHNMVW